MRSSRFARSLRLACLSAALAAATSMAAAQAGQSAAGAVDVVLHGGTIYDGSDVRPFVGDVAFTGDRIVYVGPRAPMAARRTLDVTGRIVSPGLIDAHTHPDTYIRSADPAQRLNAPWLTQGVSTVVTGVDGYGTPDVHADATKLEQGHIGTNVVLYVGFGAVRRRVLGESSRAPDAAELDRMRALVASGMCEGAVGLSTGLFYAPQSFASTEEVIALAREAALRGGIYDTHQRDESDYTIGLMASIDETLRIGREAGLPVHFAHLKALGVDLQGQAPAIVERIEKARATGQDVTADQYPWLASGSDLEASLVPRWAVDGGHDAMLTRFNDPPTLLRVKAEMRENLRRRGGPASILLTSADMPWTGKTLDAMARAWQLDPVDAAVRILRGTDLQTPATAQGQLGKAPTRPGTSIASFNMAEPDVELIMRQPWVVTSSDGSDGHPRQYATFPELYRIYVVQRHVIDVGRFVRRSTGQTADLFKLDHRGYLRPGYFADVAVLDPGVYAPRADYLKPRELSVGVDALFVNGVQAIDHGKTTGMAAGRALLRPTPAQGCAVKSNPQTAQ